MFAPHIIARFIYVLHWRGRCTCDGYAAALPPGTRGWAGAGTWRGGGSRRPRGCGPRTGRTCWGPLPSCGTSCSRPSGAPPTGAPTAPDLMRQPEHPPHAAPGKMEVLQLRGTELIKTACFGGTSAALHRAAEHAQSACPPQSLQAATCSLEWRVYSRVESFELELQAMFHVFAVVVRNRLDPTDVRLVPKVI